MAEKRSFTVAALELGVTPAAVSWTVKRLEERVGAPLLARTTRSVNLTEAGALFLEHAKASVSHVAAAFEAARTVGERPRGLLRLNLPSVARLAVEPVLAGFAAAHPDIELELAIEDSFIDIVAEGYDAGIRIGETIAQDMVAVRLTDPSRMTVAGSPAYFADRGIPLHPEQLAEHNCINFRQSQGQLYRWQFAEEQDGGQVREFDVAVPGSLIVNEAGLSVSAAVSGIGLVYNIAMNVAPQVARGQLAPCLERFMPIIPGFFIYFPSQAREQPKLRAFLEHSVFADFLTSGRGNYRLLFWKVAGVPASAMVESRRPAAKVRFLAERQRLHLALLGCERLSCSERM
ncbi:LysR family transcriptional regulator [Bosea sp. (in: a-proteobacteria)]|uniref:LysR family transcriptional regulator n=1 Tax=Bosea sp. (in: a-proteobacteria) TaxID=1871050 RepID=UPI002DDCFED7|nr:LysR substrate-binding domain-containing protein [Bosea sp. (in: a-proteobacteria)]HEV2512605.1 LysR substrate-binding domain-containing protein [Bosea sp. (in: a-proteobacteria)]